MKPETVTLIGLIGQLSADLLRGYSSDAEVIGALSRISLAAHAAHNIEKDMPLDPDLIRELEPLPEALGGAMAYSEVLSNYAEEDVDIRLRRDGHLGSVEKTSEPAASEPVPAVANVETSIDKLEAREAEEAQKTQETQAVPDQTGLPAQGD